MTGDRFYSVLRLGVSCEAASYGVGMTVKDDQGKLYVSEVHEGRHIWVEQSSYDSLVIELRSLHRRTTTDYAGRQHEVCEHCIELCHSRSGLMCDEPDAQWPCETIKLVDRLFPSAT